jgi:hypothetical protein
MHCSIDRQALDIKCLPEGLKSVLDNVVKTVNFIKAYPMNTRICGGLCKKMGIIQNCLLTHTKVRWLSCDNTIFVCLFEHKDDVYTSIDFSQIQLLL